jgi:L-lactate dehydrogenase complex protein LldG
MVALRTPELATVSAREEILARIRAATAADPPPRQPVAGAGGGEQWRMTSSLRGAPLLDLLAERLSDYRAIVQRAKPDQLGDAVATALSRRGARRVAVPIGLQVSMPAGIEVVAGDGLAAPDVLDALDGVVTGATLAIAETGTIVLDTSLGQGRRAVTLVPDYHLCIVHADQVVHIVPEAVLRLAPHATQPLTWISGPSATSDIELNRVEGVHGPRTLEVIIVSGHEPGDAAEMGRV